MVIFKLLAHHRAKMKSVHGRDQDEEYNFNDKTTTPEHMKIKTRALEFTFMIVQTNLNIL